MLVKNQIVVKGNLRAAVKEIEALAKPTVEKPKAQGTEWVRPELNSKYVREYDGYPLGTKETKGKLAGEEVVWGTVPTKAQLVELQKIRRDCESLVKGSHAFIELWEDNPTFTISIVTDLRKDAIAHDEAYARGWYWSYSAGCWKVSPFGKPFKATKSWVAARRGYTK